MRKIVPLVAIPIIVLVLIGLNFYALSNLQFRGHSTEKFDVLDMSMDTTFEACNPTFFPASFDKMTVDIVYKSTNFGSATIWGKTIQPNTPTLVDGRINLESDSILQLFVGALGSVFGGEQLEFDPNQIRFVSKLDAPLLGFIPYSVSQEYSSDEFTGMMQGEQDQWGCGGSANEDFLGDNSFLGGVQNPPTSELTREQTSGPPDSGPLGSEHSHAAILVRIFGDKFDFSAPAYQLKSSWIHFEGNDGSTVHKHATGITLGYLFNSLRLGVDEQCFEFQDGRSFCTNEDYSLKFYINGQKVNDIRDYSINDDDRILISYGQEDKGEIASQLTELANQKILK